MNNLSQKKCIPCSGGTPPLSVEQVEQHLSELTGWDLKGVVIQKDYSFKDFKQAMAFVNEVADIAEYEGHHPDITISFNKVHIELTTHAIKGLSINDFIIAAKIDEIQ